MKILFCYVNNYSLKEQEKVEREAQALAKLQCANIVRYFNSWKQYAPSNWLQSKIWKHLPSSESRYGRIIIATIYNSF